MPPSDTVLRGSGDAPTPSRLLGTPLDFLSEDHLRERQICAVIDALAMSPLFDCRKATVVLRFLNEELNMHLRDEAEDLFPLLARRCTAEDAIADVIGRIKADQDQAMRLLPDVRAMLAGCLDRAAQLTGRERATLTRLAAHMRRHLVAENAILLPMARARLTRADLRAMAQHMRLRRGLPDEPEMTDAD